MRLKLLVFLFFISNIYTYSNVLKKNLIPGKIPEKSIPKIDSVLNEKIWGFDGEKFNTVESKVDVFIQVSTSLRNDSTGIPER